MSYGILRFSLGVFHAFRVCIFLRNGLFNYSTFLGGWNPVMFLGFIPGAVWFALKFSSVVFLLIWFRVTFPRIRGDQLMEFGWKVLLPIALANIFLTALIKELFF
ncbi:NADH-quinone oxidoreductase subunit H [Bacillus toyonensis]